MRRTPAWRAESPSLQLRLTDTPSAGTPGRSLSLGALLIFPALIGLCFSEQSTPPCFAGQDKFFQCFFQNLHCGFHVAWGRPEKIPFLWLVKLARMVFFQVCNLDFRIIFAFLKMPGDATGVWRLLGGRMAQSERIRYQSFFCLLPAHSGSFSKRRFRQATSCHGFPTRTWKDSSSVAFLDLFPTESRIFFSACSCHSWPILSPIPMFLQVLCCSSSFFDRILPRSDPSLLQNGSHL